MTRQTAPRVTRLTPREVREAARSDLACASQRTNLLQPRPPQHLPRQVAQKDRSLDLQPHPPRTPDSNKKRSPSAQQCIPIQACLRGYCTRQQVAAMRNAEVDSSFRFLQESLEEAVRRLLEARPANPVSFLGHALFDIVGVQQPPAPPAAQPQNKPQKRPHRVRQRKRPGKQCKQQEQFGATIPVVEVGPIPEPSVEEEEDEEVFPCPYKLQADWRRTRGRKRVQIPTKLFPMASADALLPKPKVSMSCTVQHRPALLSVPSALDFTETPAKSSHPLQKRLPHAEAESLSRKFWQDAVVDRTRPKGGAFITNADDDADMPTPLVQSKVFLHYSCCVEFSVPLLWS